MRGPTCGHGAGGLLDAEPRVWLGRSGVVFGVNFSALKILPAPMEATLKTGNYTAAVAPGPHVASLFPNRLGCAQGTEMNFYISR